jgi:hypothetical protein
MLAVERREVKAGENPFTPHPCIRVLGWNSLSWLVKKEREEKGM